MEIWKDIPGYEGSYQCSTHGRIKSLGRYVNSGRRGQRWIKEKFLKLSKKTDGYLITALGTENGRTYYVHQLVAITFLNHKINRDDGPQLNHKFRNIVFFYDTCLQYIPKGKYNFITPPRRKKKDYDYEFLKYLAKDLNESIKTCEGYYDMYLELGILDRERDMIFSKYGIETETNVPQQTSYDLIKQYGKLAGRLKKMGYIKRNRLTGGIGMRKYIYSELGISQSTYYKLKYINDRNPRILKDIDKGVISVRNAYLQLSGNVPKDDKLTRTLKLVSKLTPSELAVLKSKL